MNILIPHSWLLEHLDTKATPKQIQEYLSLCGPSVERIYEREGDSVYDIEVTTNRVDSMSVRGIAREAAVILNQFGVKATLRPYNTAPIVKEAGAPSLTLPKIINDEQLCRRIVCVGLAGAERVATPEWMARRLRQVELNVHDVVIDITNYITHDLGHPCHAFDSDALMSFGGTIIIKTAKAGQLFTTLDGNTYTTIGGELVFENEQGEIIDLPGIKGTANTAIQDGTRNVLFFIENSLPEKIRFGSMSHAIRTVAAQLNEKNVDPHLALPVLEAGTALFQQLSGAKIATKLLDTFPGKRRMNPVTLTHDAITAYLGIELSVNDIATILETLGCEVEMKKGKFTVQPPTFRPDITIPADVIEEIARIYGYHNLPSVLMPTRIPLSRPTDTDFTLENRIKRYLSAVGWQELYTYSMVSESLAKASGFALEEHLHLQNPLSDDRVYMRRSLVPSLIEVIEQNPQHSALAVFELACTYHPQDRKLPKQELQLTCVAARPLAQVKGDLEALFQQFFLTAVLYEQKGHRRAIISASTPAGKRVTLGTIEQRTATLVAVELPLSLLISAAQTHPAYHPLPKTTGVREAITFTVPRQTQVGEVMRTLTQQSVLIRDVRFTGQYEQNLSFTFVYQDEEQQIADETVAAIRAQIVAAVEKAHHAKLVGTLQPIHTT